MNTTDTYKPTSFDDTSDDPGYMLAGVCTAGGIAAAALTRSPAWAVKGVGIGALYGATGYKVKQHPSPVAHGMGIATSAILALSSLPRAIRTTKTLPMAVTTLGVLNTAYYGRKYYDLYVY